MPKQHPDITIVGGGDNGLLTALSIRQCNPKMDITIVDDFTQDPPDIGKSTFQKMIPLLHSFLEIDLQEFIKEVKPIWKGAVYFRDWCGYDPFHFAFDNPMKFPSENDPNTLEYYYHHYDELYDSTGHQTNGEEIVDQQKSPLQYNPSDGGYDIYNHVAYHLNTHRFNQFLRKKCEERAITLVDDKITDVHRTDGNHVKKLQSETNTYSADLYIDASGFSRVIKKELDSDFNYFDHPLNSAFHAKLDRSLSDVEPATVVETGEYGWFWQIDTFDNRDVGYVFASEFVDDDEALGEFITHCDGNISERDIDKYEFESGFYNQAWEGNCIAIGNAEGIVEPLQSTNLTAHFQSAQILSDILSSAGGFYDQSHRRMYNSWVENLFNSIYDFICVHYLYGTGDTEFWNSVTSLDVSKRVEHIIDAFDNFGYAYPVNTVENTPGLVNTVVFHPIQFYLIMRNMGAESDFYENNDIHVSEEVKISQDEQYRNVSDTVDQYLTVEEVYKGTLKSAEIS